jgi:hypothetical protein
MATAYPKRSISELVSAFAKAAAEQAEFMAAFDPKRANSKFDQMAKLYGELRRRGSEAQRQLLALLESENPHIRLQAAIYTLDFEPEIAEKVITSIFRNETGSLRSEARMTLEQWRKGEIKFSWVPG